MIIRIFLPTLFGIAFLVHFSNCWDGKDRYLGKLPAPITKNTYFKIYQSNEFEQFTAIYGEIVNGQDSLIARRHHLTGTDLYEWGTSNFQVGEYDSIIYLTYYDPKEIIGVYDLKNNMAYPFNAKDYRQSALDADSLLKRLQYFDVNLVGYWNH